MKITHTITSARNTCIFVLAVSVGIASISPSTEAAIAAYSWRWTPTNPSLTSGITTAVLTPDGTDTFTVQAFKNGRLFMAAPSTNKGINLREVFWASGAQDYVDSQTCATWNGESTNMLQEGLALRISQSDGRTRAVTMTKNTIFNIHWVFNILTWDTSDSSQPYKGIAQFDMSNIIFNEIHAYEYMPWRTCIRAVGNKLDFKIWFPSKMSEPSWIDTNYVRSVTLPADYVYAGKNGWYIGHIPAGGNAGYSQLQTYRRVRVPLPAPSPANYQHR